MWLLILVCKINCDAFSNGTNNSSHQVFKYSCEVKCEGKSVLKTGVERGMVMIGLWRKDASNRRARYRLASSPSTQSDKMMRVAEGVE